MIKQVWYPGLPSHPDHYLARKIFTSGGPNSTSGRSKMQTFGGMRTPLPHCPTPALPVRLRLKQVVYIFRMREQCVQRAVAGDAVPDRGCAAERERLARSCGVSGQGQRVRRRFRQGAGSECASFQPAQEQGRTPKACWRA